MQVDPSVRSTKPAPRGKLDGTGEQVPDGAASGAWTPPPPQPESPKPVVWNVYKLANKAVWLGAVEAPDEAAAIEKAAAEFKVPAKTLMALRRS